MTRSTLPCLSSSLQPSEKLQLDLNDPLIRELVRLAGKYIADQDKAIERFGLTYEGQYGDVIRSAAKML